MAARGVFPGSDRHGGDVAEWDARLRASESGCGNAGGRCFTKRRTIGVASLASIWFISRALRGGRRPRPRSGTLNSLRQNVLHPLLGVCDDSATARDSGPGRRRLDAVLQECHVENAIAAEPFLLGQPEARTNNLDRRQCRQLQHAGLPWLEHLQQIVARRAIVALKERLIGVERKGDAIAAD